MKSLSHTGYREPGGTLQPKIPGNTFPDNWKGVKVWFNLGSRCCFWWVFRSRYVKYEQLNRCQRRKRFGQGQENEDTGKKRHLIDVNKQGVDVWFSLGSRRCFGWVFRLRYVKVRTAEQMSREKTIWRRNQEKEDTDKKGTYLTLEVVKIWSYQVRHSRSPLYGHPLNTDSSLIRKVFLIPLALTFSLNSTRLIRIPC